MNIDPKKEAIVRKKLQKFMAEIGSDLLEDDEMDKIRELIHTKLRNLNLPFTLPYMKAFFEGLQTGAAAEAGDMGVPMMSGVARMVAELEVELEQKVQKRLRPEDKE